MPATSSFKIAPNALKENADTPLYQQLYDLLRKQIISGKIEKNAYLPSEQELVDKLGISRITARRALNELAAAGLVKRHRGRGTIVTFNASAPSLKASFENLIEGLTRMGVKTVAKLIDSRVIKPKKELAEMMELPAGARVLKIKRLRYMDNEPFSYLVTHIPEEIASSFPAHELETASIIGLLEKSGHAPYSARQTITSVAAVKDVAAALGIAPGATLLRIQRIMRDANGKIIQEITSHYRGDRVQYEMDHVRQDDANWTHAE